MKKPKGDFFGTPTEASRRKQRIVVKYHAAWSQVLRSKRGSPAGFQCDLAYVDLFAGPGKYGDESQSTPLLIIEAAARDAYMREHLVTRFNEGDPVIAERLEKNLKASDAAKELNHRPRVTCALVEQDILKEIGGIPRCPTLLFADPWGYKGLSVALLAKFLRPFGNDLIFFFNYNRIASGLQCSVLDEPIDAVFGKKVADALRNQIASKALKGIDKEREIMNALGAAFAPFGAQVPVQFPFQTKGRLSHHLMFISKNPLGNEIMKGVMAVESTRGTFGFDEATEAQPLLFADLPIEELASALLERFAGKTVRFSEIGVERHPQLGLSAHRRAVQKLEHQRKVCVISYEKARRLTKDGLSVPDDAILVFSGGDEDGTQDADRMD
jgi:three-Cys-motif partner protein